METLLPLRSAIAAALAAPIRAALQRHDTTHAAFHGCVDWHSAVHGTWALVAYARMTGDTGDDGLIAEILTPGKLAAERALLAANPDFEMPYGRAWLLRLAREHGHSHGVSGGSAARASGAGGPLQSLADEVLASLLAHYRCVAPDPRRGGYGSDSWALLNMLEYARWSGDTAAEAGIRRLVEAHFLDPGAGCGYALEHSHFMAVATNWAWLVGKVLPAHEFCAWRRTFFAATGLPQPVTEPVGWHHHGLNFSRAWGLAALAAAAGPGQEGAAYRAAYARHVRATYDRPELWNGSYRGVGHWVPQFGMLAVQPMFERGQMSACAI